MYSLDWVECEKNGKGHFVFSFTNQEPTHVLGFCKKRKSKYMNMYTTNPVKLFYFQQCENTTEK